LTALLELGAIPLVFALRAFVPKAALRSSVAGVAFTAVTMGFAFEVGARKAPFPALLLSRWLLRRRFEFRHQADNERRKKKRKKKTRYIGASLKPPPSYFLNSPA
jgi:hypothetical protein